MTGIADPQASRAWAITWVALYRLIRLVDPLIRSWMALGLPGFDGVVELRTAGRRTGRPRRVLVTLLDRDGQCYVGHPNGETSWQRNAEVAGSIEVEPAAAHGARFALRRLPRGTERDDVIAATGRQQFFPANVLYRASRRHIAAVGVYHRLVPIPAGAESPQAPKAPPPASIEGAR